jgi:hypothetical protein
MLRLCGEVGFRFAKNFAIPRSAYDNLCKKMDVVKARFDAQLATFMASYETRRQEWKAKYPTHAHIIDGGTLGRDGIKAKFFLGYQAFAINGISMRDQAGDVTDSAPTLLSGLAGRLYVEVAKTARQLQGKLIGRDTVTNRFLNPVRALESKLSGLSFLDPGIAPMVDEINRVLASLPKANGLAGNDLLAVRGLLSLLADPQGLRAHAKALGSQAALLFAEEEDDDEGTDANDVGISPATATASSQVVAGGESATELTEATATVDDVRSAQETAVTAPPAHVSSNARSPWEVDLTV